MMKMNDLNWSYNTNQGQTFFIATASSRVSNPDILGYTIVCDTKTNTYIVSTISSQGEIDRKHAPSIEAAKDICSERESYYMEVIKLQYDNLNDLANQAMEIVKQNGWDVLKESDWEDTYKIPALLALIGSEVSEVLEAFRKNNKENFKEEMVDIIIRALEVAYIFDPDIEQTIANKMAKNKKRGYRHGGKRL